jgi:hypothetical protein
MHIRPPSKQAATVCLFIELFGLGFSFRALRLAVAPWDYLGHSKYDDFTIRNTASQYVFSLNLASAEQTHFYRV